MREALTDQLVRYLHPRDVHIHRRKLGRMDAQRVLSLERSARLFGIFDPEGPKIEEDQKTQTEVEV